MNKILFFINNKINKELQEQGLKPNRNYFGFMDQENKEIVTILLGDSQLIACHLGDCKVNVTKKFSAPSILYPLLISR